jgi:hypothetical protein
LEDRLQLAQGIARDFPDDWLLHDRAATFGGDEPVLSKLIHPHGLFAVHGHDQLVAVHGAVADQDAFAVDDQFEVLYFAARVHVESLEVGSQ